ncbi:hypothetical protein A2954_07385 [Candidatus Roizmanbacteria bacterium RIFCSPLOWO2_01_FULL_37_12]|uniref:Uncharacterized protein n=1 Tax=Candidatus Roizmanbacteria bacterium RIFCSPLOWO2_01_FULL_37_12 TaxID=1802056 RepID=A0A1F7IE91_9BACT|nr:MAG: hypothetical protein A3D76_04490 [Candidatus Roizmanbacteria bacterium RIFCSPHIGHO2_02_FULL_37_9b]OGK41672.1 MAG: hypothetical protein A2954_07385 [Candidatus Roizmanbacteria bacterium RIFCSPLOWO2_01_FULL_37_12]
MIQTKYTSKKRKIPYGMFFPLKISENEISQVTFTVDLCLDKTTKSTKEEKIIGPFTTAKKLVKSLKSNN